MVKMNIIFSKTIKKVYLKESIKWQHNDISNYIINNLIDEKFHYQQNF